MKTLRIFCRVFIGLLFIFSGYVKAIDPIGSQIIFTEDFKAFQMPFLIPFTMFFGVVLSTVEILIGCCALMGIRMKETAWLNLLFMSFMTIFTFILAVFNPVTDCGCFGEAIKLTNWETFFKNILVIMPVTIVMFWQRNKYKSVASCRVEWITVACLTLLTLGLMHYSFRHLPSIDFMSYRVGTNIEEAMSYPENAETDVYETILHYKKDGKTQDFTIQNLPDSTWKFIDAVTTLVKKGYEPPIHDFAIISHEGDDITNMVLNLDGYVLLLSIPYTEKASLKNKDAINAIADYCLIQDNMHFFALSSSGDEALIEYARETGAMYPFYMTDEKPLLSMVRSNPGLLLMKDAVVLAKWSHYDIPTPEKLSEKIRTQSPEKMIAEYELKERLTTEIIAVALFAAMILWGIICRRIFRKNGNTAKLFAEKA